jgi:hypothetical protein
LPRQAAGRSAAGGVLRGFPPIIDGRTETLILGSFPSEASLAAGQYYAHPRNQFWRLLGALLGEPLAELDYGERAARVLAHRFGIWDVLDACRRPGSLDADIRDARPDASPRSSPPPASPPGCCRRAARRTPGAATSRSWPCGGPRCR